MLSSVGGSPRRARFHIIALSKFITFGARLSFSPHVKWGYCFLSTRVAPASPSPSHLHSTAQHNSPQHSTAQHTAAQHNTAQHSTAHTAQHSTAQHMRQHTHIPYIRYNIQYTTFAQHTHTIQHTTYNIHTSYNTRTAQPHMFFPAASHPAYRRTQ